MALSAPEGAFQKRDRNLKTQYHHNPHLSECIRQENDVFNQSWIKSVGLLGSESVSVTDLNVPEEQKHNCSPFVVVWLKNIDRLHSMFCNYYDPSDFDLVDLGCGSGISTIYFKSKYHFKDVSGVDFCSNLIGLALKNNKTALKNNVIDCEIEFHCRDARDYRLPNKRSAVFLFNPFGWSVMESFVRNNLSVLRGTHAVFILANDLLVNDLTKYCRLIDRDDTYNLSIVEFV